MDIFFILSFMSGIHMLMSREPNKVGRVDFMLTYYVWIALVGFMLEPDVILICLAVFSAVYWLELSLDNEQHKCRSIACVYNFYFWDLYADESRAQQSWKSGLLARTLAGQ